MLNKISNNPPRPQSQQLSEGLQYKDLDGMCKNTIHVDEFASKMGDDQDILVLSFFLRDKQAAKDLTSWFEKGYDFVLDADRSPGEIKPNRYLVYVEIRRRRAASQQIEQLLDDLSTLTEYDADEWHIHYEGKTFPWNEETFRKIVPLTPDDYRAAHEKDLNEWRAAAGLPEKQIRTVKPDVRELQHAAGI